MSLAPSYLRGPRFFAPCALVSLVCACVVIAMSTQGSVFLSRHRLKDVLVDSGYGGNGDESGGDGSGGSGGIDTNIHRCADTKQLTGISNSARSDLTGPEITVSNSNAATTQPTHQSNVNVDVLMSMVSSRLDQMQAAMLERLGHRIHTTTIAHSEDSQPNLIQSTNESTNESINHVNVAQHTAVILERLDRMDAKISAQQEILVRLEHAVSSLTGRWRDD